MNDQDDRERDRRADHAFVVGMFVGPFSRVLLVVELHRSPVLVRAPISELPSWRVILCALDPAFGESQACRATQIRVTREAHCG